jgi:hypothetical protein
LGKRCGDVRNVLLKNFNHVCFCLSPVQGKCVRLLRVVHGHRHRRANVLRSLAAHRPGIPQPALAVDGLGDIPPAPISAARPLGTVLDGRTRWENFPEKLGSPLVSPFVPSDILPKPAPDWLGVDGALIQAEQMPRASTLHRQPRYTPQPGASRPCRVPRARQGATVPFPGEVPPSGVCRVPNALLGPVVSFPCPEEA